MDKIGQKVAAAASEHTCLRTTWLKMVSKTRYSPQVLLPECLCCVVWWWEPCRSVVAAGVRGVHGMRSLVAGREGHAVFLLLTTPCGG